MNITKDTLLSAIVAHLTSGYHGYHGSHTLNHERREPDQTHPLTAMCRSTYSERCGTARTRLRHAHSYAAGDLIISHRENETIAQALERRLSSYADIDGHRLADEISEAVASWDAKQAAQRGAATLSPV